MSTKGRKTKSKNTVIFYLLFVCMLLYILTQLAAVSGVLPTRHGNVGLLSIFGKDEPRMQPYISFLASVVTPEARLIDKDCMWELQANRTFMSTLENLLPNPKQATELVQFLKREITACISSPGNDTALQNSTDTNSTFLNSADKSFFPVGWVSLDAYHAKECLATKAELSDLVPVDLKRAPPGMSVIGMEYPQLNVGGFYPGPKFCKPRHSTAIIIPYRDRDLHLRYWLHYTLGTLIKQQLRFTVFVVEQEGTGVFNKGQLMNTAFVWATNNAKFDCFIFHDVDMIPEVPGNFYECAGSKTVSHLSPFIDKFNYTSNSKHGITVGGVVAFTEWQYRAVNGYSNVYWGWGGEDDDMNIRMKITGLKRIRPIWEYGRYKMIPHSHDNGNPVNTIRHQLLKKAQERMGTDGITDLQTSITKVLLLPTHTHIIVRVPHHEPPPTTTTKPKAAAKIDTKPLHVIPLLKANGVKRDAPKLVKKVPVEKAQLPQKHVGIAVRKQNS